MSAGSKRPAEASPERRAVRRRGEDREEPEDVPRALRALPELLALSPGLACASRGWALAVRESGFAGLVSRLKGAVSACKARIMRLTMREMEELLLTLERTLHDLCEVWLHLRDHVELQRRAGLWRQLTKDVKGLPADFSADKLEVLRVETRSCGATQVVIGPPHPGPPAAAAGAGAAAGPAAAATAAAAALPAARAALGLPLAPGAAAGPGAATGAGAAGAVPAGAVPAAMAALGGLGLPPGFALAGPPVAGMIIAAGPSLTAPGAPGPGLLAPVAGLPAALAAGLAASLGGGGGAPADGAAGAAAAGGAGAAAGAGAGPALPLPAALAGMQGHLAQHLEHLAQALQAGPPAAPAAPPAAPAAPAAGTAPAAGLGVLPASVQETTRVQVSRALDFRVAPGMRPGRLRVNFEFTVPDGGAPPGGAEPEVLAVTLELPAGKTLAQAARRNAQQAWKSTSAGEVVQRWEATRSAGEDAALQAAGLELWPFMRLMAALLGAALAPERVPANRVRGALRGGLPGGGGPLEREVLLESQRTLALAELLGQPPFAAFA